MTGPRVFIPQEPLRRGPNDRLISVIDLKPAAQFGELVRILEHGREPALDPATSLPIIIQKLGDVTAEDFLLPVGQPTVIAWTAIYMAAKTARIQMLVWDDRHRKYDVVSANLREFLNL